MYALLLLSTSGFITCVPLFFMHIVCAISALLLQLTSVSTNPPSSLVICDSSSGFAPSQKSCVLQSIVKNKLRVAFLDYPFTTQNNPAIQKAAQLGIAYSCDDSTLAVPEW